MRTRELKRLCERRRDVYRESLRELTQYELSLFASRFQNGNSTFFDDEGEPRWGVYVLEEWLLNNTDIPEYVDGLIAEGALPPRPVLAPEERDTIWKLIYGINPEAAEMM